MASSFKYRIKAKESSLPHTATRQSAAAKQEAEKSFQDIVKQMQQANLGLAQGSDSLYDRLWSQRDDVTLFAGNLDSAAIGWEAVREGMQLSARQIAGANTYATEKVTSDVADDQAYIVQQEHYGFPGGRTVSLQATVIFRKEGDTWKIFHRHSDYLSAARESDKKAN